MYTVFGFKPGEEGKQGPAGKSGIGSPGIGFKLTKDGNYDILNRQLKNVQNPTEEQDAVNINYLQANAILLDPTKDEFTAIHRKITNLAAPKNSTDAVHMRYVNNNTLTIEGSVYNAKNRKISFVKMPVDSLDVVNKEYCDSSVRLDPEPQNKLKRTQQGLLVSCLGVDADGDFVARNKRIKLVAEPKEKEDVTTKNYVDGTVAISMEPFNQLSKKKDGLYAPKSVTWDGSAFDIQNQKLINLPTPIADSEPATLYFLKNSFINSKTLLPYEVKLSADDNLIKAEKDGLKVSEQELLTMLKKDLLINPDMFYFDKDRILNIKYVTGLLDVNREGLYVNLTNAISDKPSNLIKLSGGKLFVDEDQLAILVDNNTIIMLNDRLSVQLSKKKDNLLHVDRGLYLSPDDVLNNLPFDDSSFVIHKDTLKIKVAPSDNSLKITSNGLHVEPQDISVNPEVLYFDQNKILNIKIAPDNLLKITNQGLSVPLMLNENSLFLDANRGLTVKIAQNPNNIIKTTQNGIEASGPQLINNQYYDFANKRISNLKLPLDANDAVSKQYIDQISQNFLQGDLVYDAKGRRIGNLGYPTEKNNAASKYYVDIQVHLDNSKENILERTGKGLYVNSLRFKDDAYSASGKRISHVMGPSDLQDAVNLSYLNLELKKIGTELSTRIQAITTGIEHKKNQYELDLQNINEAIKTAGGWVEKLDEFSHRIRSEMKQEFDTRTRSNQDRIQNVKHEIQASLQNIKNLLDSTVHSLNKIEKANAEFKLQIQQSIKDQEKNADFKIQLNERKYQFDLNKFKDEVLKLIKQDDS